MSNKNKYDQFNLPPTGPNLCDFYGQYIGFGGGGPTGVQLTSITKSALFDSANEEYLSRTPDSAGNLRKWTLSLWAYRGDLGTSEFKLWSAVASSNFDMVAFSGNELGIEINTSASNTNSLRSNALFRDIGWYHIVVVWDSDNSAATNRIRFWVNGVRITSLRVSAFPGSAGVDSLTNSTVLHTVGAKANVSQYFDGFLAETVLINGSALEPTAFAEYDPTGTFWVPKSPTVIKALTFGDTGFYLDNSTNAQTDASGEGNNFTNNNTVLNSSHTPTNLISSLNPVYRTTDPVTLSAGNLVATYGDAGNHNSAKGTIPYPPSGKWYFEATYTNDPGGSARVGVSGVLTQTDSNYVGETADGFGYVEDGNKVTGGSASSYGNTYAEGDIIGVYMDRDNNAIFFSKNGTPENSASTGEIIAGTTTNAAFTSVTTAALFPSISHANNGAVWTVNFGDSSFNTALLAGYLALNTTNIAAATTRTKSDLSEYFESIVYEGNGFGQIIGRHLPFTNAFTVGNSALFNRDNSESLSKTFGSAGSSTTNATINVWIKQGSSIENRGPLIYVDGSSSDFQIEINIDGNDHKLRVDLSYDSANHVKLSSQGFRDQSQWAMVTCILDTTNGTASERIRLYWNGVRLALETDNTIAQNQAIILGSAVEHQIGALETSYYYDGYMAQFVFTDGQILEPTNFGLVDAATGRWVPKDVSGLTFGNNGFFLDFATGTLGNDVSGNNNDFANNNTVVQTNDSPTTNFGTLLNNLNSAEVITNGNRSARGVSGQSYWILPSGLRMTTEKIFVACRMDDGADGSSQVNVSFGCQPPNANIDAGNVSPPTDSYALVDRQGGEFRVYNNAYDDAPGSLLRENHTISAADTDVITMAVDPSDPSNGKVWFGVYDTSEDSHQYIPNVVGGTAGDPALGTLPTVDGINFKGPTNPLGEWRIITGGYRHTAATTILVDSTDIPITIPSGFLEYKQSNAKLGRTIATGASADQVTPSYTTAWSWLKNRDAADSHMMFDRVRGVAKDLHTDATAVEVTDPNTMYQFLRGGVQVGNDVQVNTQIESYVAWNWYFENTGSGSSNTDGSINTTSTLVDTNIGISISTYTGTGSNATVGHGLAVAPEFIIIKNRGVTDPWAVYYGDNTDYMVLNTNAATVDDATMWQDTTPTSTVWSIGTNHQVNADGENYIAYCFAPSQFSAIGSYNGNGNANGTFVPTVNSLGIPITPSWIMLKRTDAANSWAITDTARTPTNPTSFILQAQLANAQLDNSDIDVLQGGFKIRSTDNLHNNSSGNYVYLAFGTPIIDTSGRILTGR